MELRRNPSRPVRIGKITIGDNHPIALQSMTATHTRDIDATVQQVNDLSEAGADVVRIAVDSKQDAIALAEIRRQTSANLSWPSTLRRTWTSCATIRDTFIIISGTIRGKKRSDIWLRWQRSTIVPCAWESTAAVSTRRA